MSMSKTKPAFAGVWADAPTVRVRITAASFSWSPTMAADENLIALESGDVCDLPEHEAARLIAAELAVLA